MKYLPNLDTTADREEVSRPSMKLEIPTKKNVNALKQILNVSVSLQRQKMRR